jgi:predicted acyl esterase
MLAGLRLNSNKLLVLLPAAVLLSHCSSGSPAASQPDATVDAASASDTGASADTGVAADTGPGADASPDAGADAVAEPGTATFTVQGSVAQVFVTHAAPGAALDLRTAAGASAGKGVADALGSLVFRKVAPGKGYRVYAVGTAPELFSAAVDVLAVADSLPPQSFYANQTIVPGTGYLKTRDGTTLAYFATLPGPADQGPYPTIVNYSGYDPGRPGSALVSGDQAYLCDAIPVLCNAPSDPSAMIAAVSGYATVSVNIRGTGCSGGAYDYFEDLQLLDGYDVIETVAAQPWVAHHKVGMTGLSYPGITQLFVAKTHPPSLAAITPLSVIGNTATTLVPGGILNKGFALNWIEHVYDKAAPYGQGWEQKQVDGGDKICKENQLLHNQRVNNVDQAKDVKYYDAKVITPLNPTAWAGEIQVPVFLAGGWQDEQTGPFFITLLDQFKSAPSRRFLVYNGVHADGFAPQVLAEWKAFLDIYVAQKVPSFSGVMGLLVPQLTQQVFDVSLSLPADRWAGIKTYADAKAEWEKEPQVQAFFENGAPDPHGAPQGQFSATFSQWPPTETKAQRWYFQPDGTLLPVAPTATAAAATFQLDPTAGDRGMEVQSLWSAKAVFDWKKPQPGNEVAFISEPLTEDLVMLGTGSVDLYLRTTATDVTDADLEVNLSEVRADGQERYVQSGWLRASFRKLAASATELWPEPSLVYADVAPLPVGPWTLVRVAIAGFGHPFRKGSRIRIAVDTPGDSRTDWRFDLLKFPHPVHYDIATSVAGPSSVVLPVLAGVAVPAGASLPACPSLRGQPCRPYAGQANVQAGP